MVWVIRIETVKSKETSQINGDNFNNIRCEASKHFRNKKREWLKELMNSKNKNLE
jgi:hypothetical protein